jgi:hypothetical protein
LAAVVAIVTAFIPEYIAHDDFGFAREDIRTPSLIAAVIIGLLLSAAYVFGRQRTPK